MVKRKGVHPDQLAFGFEPPEPASSDGALADLPRFMAQLVAAILKRDPRSRYEIAGEVSRLLDEDVSKLMLDAYASEARDAHRISFDRFLALVSATASYDMLDTAIRRIGAMILVGEEALLAEIGHRELVHRETASRLKQLKQAARPMKWDGRGQ